MDREAIVLGHILHRFPEFDFNMHDFSDRLRLQKFIYLLQAHGIYLGYDFTWYLRGPYCTMLATAGFMLEDFYDMMPDGKQDKAEGFASKAIREKFERFSKLVKNRERDADFLEVAASLHYLIESGITSSDDDAVERVMAKIERGYEYESIPQQDRKVNTTYIRDTLRELRDADLIRTTGPASATAPIELPVLEGSKAKPMAYLPRGMDSRHADKAILYMMQDAALSGEKSVGLVGKNIFRPDVKRPVPDDYIMNDGAVLDVRRRCGIGTPVRMGA